MLEWQKLASLNGLTIARDVLESTQVQMVAHLVRDPCPLTRYSRLILMFSTVRVIVVVTDGLTIGCTCCGVLHCIEPLPDGHGIRFCIPHDYLHDICAVISCEEPNVAGRKTCANPIHM